MIKFQKLIPVKNGTVREIAGSGLGFYNAKNRNPFLGYSKSARLTILTATLIMMDINM